MEIEIIKEQENCNCLHKIIMDNINDKVEIKKEYEEFYKYADANQRAFFLKHNLLYILSLLQLDEFDKLLFQLNKFNNEQIITLKKEEQLNLFEEAI